MTGDWIYPTVETSALVLQHLSLKTRGPSAERHSRILTVNYTGNIPCVAVTGKACGNFGQKPRWAPQWV